MRAAWHKTGICAVSVAALLLAGLRADALQAAPGVGPTGTPAPSAAQSAPAVAAPAGPATATQVAPQGSIEIDRVVAVVNGDLILESDVDEERRFAAFQPYSKPTGAFSRSEAVERLIDRMLILQQARTQTAEPAITDAQVDADAVELRKAIFACRSYKCETEEGWQRFLADNGFTEKEFRARWRDRMVTLRFIEQRFRMGIRITPQEIQDYYTKTLLPQYATRHVTAPKLDSIRDRIQEILLQEQVSKLLADWLTTLRASGDVRMVRAGEVTP